MSNQSIGDRTLILRICDERLRTHLREKMAAKEEEVAKAASSSSNSQHYQGGNASHFPQHSFGNNASTKTSQETKLVDLDGVLCEPAVVLGSSTPEDSTLWNFHCDGATYPARLTNLPCPVELHKTHDHAMYYKCADVAQMLIVYEDQTALEEAESMPGYKVEGFPSYYHSGLTPPMARVVEKRFKMREHAVVPPPVEEMQEVEKELIELMESLSSKDAAKKKTPKPATDKVLEVVEEDVVDYEPWMDDFGRVPEGIEFSEDDAICKNHPEVWLHPSEFKEEKKQSKETPSVSNTSSKKKKKKVSNPDAPKEKQKKKKDQKKKKGGTSGTSSVAVPVVTTDEAPPQINADATNVDGLDDEDLDFGKLDELDDFGEGIDDLDLGLF